MSSELAELDLLGLPKPKAKKEREKREVVAIRTARDAQRLQLDRLMRNPDKEVHIPERRHDNRSHKVPDFVRNVMGSSAGAGSGEFHVYRQLRKKETTRVKLMEEQAEREKLDQEFLQRLAAKEKAAEEKAARKRAKRLKKKMKDKKNRVKKAKKDGDQQSKDSSSEDDEESDADGNGGPTSPQQSTGHSQVNDTPCEGRQSEDAEEMNKTESKA